MKSATSYTEKQFSELLDKTGSFFAFSNKQFCEKKKEGIKYVNIGAGLICPKDQVKFLCDEMERIFKEGKKTDLSENGKEKIIIRELYNYECFYTGDITDAWEVLKDYEGITLEDVKKAYANEYCNADL